MRCSSPFTLLSGMFMLAGLSAAPSFADEPNPAKNGVKEVTVKAATRIDWQFAVTATFGPKAVTLPGDYDSKKQRYQLFVPKDYDAKKAWPLVVFISPGDKAGAWRFWEKPCTEMGMLYCEAYGAGNGCPVGKRTRIVLDMLDDVRRADAKARPGLTVAADEAPTAEQQAARQLETARKELEQAERTWHAAALAQGVIDRWAKSPSAEPARKFLDQLKANPEQAKLVARQQSEEEIREALSEAKVLERFGLRGKALRAWQELVEKHPDSAAGKKAVAEVKRLETAIAATPKRAYLGISFEGNTLKIGQVEKGGPADKAGLKAGDLLTKLDDAKIDSFTTLTKMLAKSKPGNEVALEVERNGQRMTVQVRLGARAQPGDE